MIKKDPAARLRRSLRLNVSAPRNRGTATFSRRFRSLFLGVLLLLAGGVAPALAQDAQFYMYGAANSSTTVFNSDGSTALTTGYVLQFIYAGTNTTADTPNTDGTVGGDDSLISARAVGDGSPFGAGTFDISLTGLTNGSRVYVRAWNSATAGSPALWGDSTVMTLGAPPSPPDVFQVVSFSTTSQFSTTPSVPTGLAVRNVSTVSGEAYWTAVSGATTYEVSYGTDTGASNVGSAETASTSYWMTGLTGTTTYYVKVRAKNAQGTSAYSSAVSFVTTTPSDSLAPLISNIKVDGRLIKSGDYVNSAPLITATVTDESSGVNTTTLSLSLGTDVYTTASTIPVTYSTSSGTLSFLVPRSLTDGAYVITVNARDNAGNISTPESFQIKIKSGDLAIVGTPFNYPNPFNPITGTTKIGYNLNASGTVTLRIFDINAQLLWQKTYYSTDTEGAHVGYNEIIWNGVTDYSEMIGNGVYLYHVVDQTTGRLLGKGKILVVK